MHKEVIDDARRKFDVIEDYYINDYMNNDVFLGPSLMKGMGGGILIQTIIYKANKTEELKKKIQKNIDILIDAIENADYLLSTYCAGLAGLGWLLLYLMENGFIEEKEVDFLEDVDVILDREMSALIEERLFDFMHGAVGLGIYFLKRKSIISLEKLIYALDRVAKRENSEIKFSSMHFVRNELTYDFGLAHGNANILYFLVKCLELGVLPEICLSLISGILSFYHNNLQDVEITGSFFPTYITVADYLSTKKKYSHSRLAWCYGDLSILNTLYLTSRVIKDKKLERDVIDMLLETTTRREKYQTNIEDAAFCHGTSGAGIIYLNLYHYTNITEFKSTALYWLKETLLMDEDVDRGIFGYSFRVEGVGNVPLSDLLDGLGGIALLLCCIIYEVDIDWAECFLLS